MESLQAEVAPFGIHTTIVNPGFFRTELLTEQSTNYAEPSIEDYDDRRGPQVEYLESTERPAVRRPRQARASAHGDCEPGAAAASFIAGADAIATTEQKVADLTAQIEANRDLLTSLDFG